MSKRCAICGAIESDAAATCSRCGEGSWCASSAQDPASLSLDGATNFDDQGGEPEAVADSTQAAPVQQQWAPRKGKRR